MPISGGVIGPGISTSTVTKANTSTSTAGNSGSSTAGVE
jgi:hypothetical protein